MNLPALTIPKTAQGLGAGRLISLLAPGGGILVALLVLVLIVWPKYSEIKELKVANVDLGARATALESKAETLSTLDRSKLEKQLSASEALVPSDKDVFVLIRQIESSAAETGILLGKVEVVPGTINDSGSSAIPAAPVVPVGAASVSGISGGGFATLSPRVQIRLSTASSYAALLNFLSKMYSIARTVAIEDITVTTGSDAQVRASFAVDAYWKPLPVDLGSIEKPVLRLTDSEAKLLDSVGEIGISVTPTIPEVPLGRSDLFAPF